MEKLIASRGPDVTIESALEELRTSGTQNAPHVERFDEPTLSHISPNVLDQKPVTARPYRHKADLREIAAELPHAVTFVSVLAMAVSAILILVLVVYLWIFLGMSVLPSPMDVISFACTLVALLMLLAPSICLYLGYDWARWVISIFLMLFMAYWFWLLRVGQVPLRHPITAMLCIGVVASIVILHRRETRHWVKFASRLRSEQRGQGSRRTVSRTCSPLR